MALTKKSYKGTRDLFPLQKREQDYIFSHFSKAAQIFGYEHYDGPLIEEVDLYKAKSGEELINEQIYSFTDRGKRFVAIRPEMTPSLARMVAQVHRETSKPIRWYSIPNLMRYERPQKGRLREHWQFNCDIFGTSENFALCEILSLAVHLMQQFGATTEHFEIRVNHRKILDEIIEKVLQLDSKSSYKLYKIIDRSKKITPDALAKELATLNISEDKQKSILEFLNITSFDKLEIFLKEHHCQDSLAILQILLKNLKSTDILNFCLFDPSVVRGLDYYTGFVFEIFDKHPDNRRALCGGGAYENLLKIFDEPALQGVGFGLGDVTLLDFLKVHNLLPDFTKMDLDFFLCPISNQGSDFIYQLVKKLRQQDFSVLQSPDVLKINKAIQQASKKGARHIILIGDDECQNHVFSVKNLKNGNDVKLNLNDFDSNIRILL
ncbi:histidine--tRNA ligase [Bacteriovoracaceae bacterium]|nr:histidine--tRNA ligase [Bacteriovoracaceae bacterium]